MASEDAAEYSKGLDHISSAKLNYFHYFLRQLTGYTIHPSTRTSFQPCRIADLGTQTAIWPITVAEEFVDSSEVDAFDVSGSFFPPASWLPSNVRLHLHDILVPFPERFHAQFDLVHLRLFLTLSPTQVALIIQNAITLLKPGGYIQWTEHDKSSIIPTAVSSELSTNALQKFLELQKMPFPNYNFQWINEIAPIMAQEGLKVMAEDRIRVRPSMFTQMNELHLISLADVPAGLSQAIDGYRDKYLERLKEEYRSGVSTIDGFICVVGKRT